MGFGLLFVGYLFLLPVTLSFYYTLPVAAVFLAWGCFRLRRVNLPFGWATYPAALIGVFGLLAGLADNVGAMNVTLPYFATAAYVCLLAWHCLALTGLAWVAEETGLKKLRFAAVRNRLFACIYLLPAAFLAAVEQLPVGEKALNWLVAFRDAFLLVGLIVLILILVSLFTAYMRICMPEDLQMPRKPSRFASVNRRREEADRREAEAREKARQEAMRRAQARKKKKKK